VIFELLDLLLDLAELSTEDDDEKEAEERLP
jgi:hypothetical protein